MLRPLLHPNINTPTPLDGFQDLSCGIVTRDAADAATGVSTGTAKVDIADFGTILAAAQHWSGRE